MGLEDYKDIIATSASISTIGHMLSGSMICKDFYKKGTSEDFDPSPFIGGIGISILMLRYALVLHDPAMVIVNIFGISINILYMIIYMIYAPSKTNALQLIGKFAGFVLMILTYAEYENKELLEFRLGIIVSIIMLLLVGMPLIHLGKIIQTKDTSILPFPLVFMGSIVFFQWLMYGLIINNKFIIFQNGVGFTLSAAQLALFVIYPTKSKEIKKTE